MTARKMKRIKSILQAVYRSLVGSSPEIFLGVFVLCMAPLVLMAFREFYSLAGLLFSDAEAFFDMLNENRITVAAAVVCVFGCGGAVVLFIKAWNSIWAVARKMILEALNRKVVLILLLFFVILMPSLPFILETEGALKSQVQIVLTYSLALAEILLSVLAVFVCTASVCSEIDRKQVHITDTKPLKRGQFLAGKLVGVVILCGVLLFLMSGSVYGIDSYLARDRSFEHLRPWEAREKMEDLRRVREEVMVARHSISPSTPDVSDYVESRVEELRQRGELTTAGDVNRAKREAREEAIRRRTTAPSRGEARFTFSGLDPDLENPVYLRARPNKTNPDADHLCPGLWVFVLPHHTESGETRYAVAGTVQQQLSPDAFQEIALPPEVIGPAGTVRVIYENQCDDTGVYFDLDDGIEVMQKVGGFRPNLYRSLLVVLAHIFLLSALSIMLGAVFSFPVASFCVGAVLVIGLLGPWAAEHALEVHEPFDATVLQFIGFQLKRAIFTGLRGILVIAPQFGRFSPIEHVANGRLVGLGYAARVAALMVFLQGGVIMLLATYFYWRRELARIIV